MDVSHRVFKALPSTAHPITVTEFLGALSKVWTATQSPHGREAETFGLAISGGVDSMALAALCSRLQSTSLGNGLPPLGSLRRVGFRAFVVDHGVRDGSATEARAVAKILEGRGIQTQILPINWAGRNRPADNPNFESLARRYRYQLMGKACKDLGIRSLLLAHHEDDQAETVLMRLIKGHGRLGLMGMKSGGGIPECYGIHGVYESGEAFNLDEPLVEHHPEHATTHSAPRPKQGNMRFHTQLPVETGGIKVYRPLLGVAKDKLIATCQAEGMGWFEDHTNKDPTLTTRNAIRHMYNSHHIPTALTKPALLKLSERCRASNASQHEATKLWLAKCSIGHFETRTGTLDIRFPNYEAVTSTQEMGNPLIAANILRHIIMLVTPEEHVPLSNLHGAVQRVFPELFPRQALSMFPTAFTVAGVEFRPFHKNILADIGSSPSIQGVEKCRWLISRQAYTSIPPSRPLITVPPRSTPGNQTWSEWALYDGRYWIRINNQGPLPILILPFLKDDLQNFRQSLSVDDQRRLKRLLKSIAPGAVRWTLPSLVIRGSDAQEVVFALPSLDIRTPQIGASVEWEIRYKKLYKDGLPELKSSLEG